MTTKISTLPGGYGPVGAAPFGGGGGMTVGPRTHRLTVNLPTDIAAGVEQIAPGPWAQLVGSRGPAAGRRRPLAQATAGERPMTPGPGRPRTVQKGREPLKCRAAPSETPVESALCGP